MIDIIRKTILEYVDIPEEKITEDTDFVTDLEMNSYDLISMIGQLEESLCIEIPDTEIRDLKTVGDVAEYLKQKVAD